MFYLQLLVHTFNASAKIGAPTSREVGLAVPGAVIGAGVAAFDEAAQGKDLEDFDFGKVATGAAIWCWNSAWCLG